MHQTRLLAEVRRLRHEENRQRFRSCCGIIHRATAREREATKLYELSTSLAGVQDDQAIVRIVVHDRDSSHLLFQPLALSPKMVQLKQRL